MRSKFLIFSFLILGLALIATNFGGVLFTVNAASNSHPFIAPIPNSLVLVH